MDIQGFVPTAAICNPSHGLSSECLVPPLILCKGLFKQQPHTLGLFGLCISFVRCIDSKLEKRVLNPLKLAYLLNFIFVKTLSGRQRIQPFFTPLINSSHCTLQFTKKRFQCHTRYCRDGMPGCLMIHLFNLQIYKAEVVIKLEQQPVSHVALVISCVID